MAHIDDRWLGKNKEHTSRHGTGRRWRVRYQDPSGRWRSKSFDRKAQADDFLTEVKGQIRSGTYVDPGAGKVTLASYAAQWLASQTTAVTTQERQASHLKLHILPRLGGRSLGDLAQHPSAVQSWLSGIDLAPTTVHVILATLSAILSAAVEDGLIIRNPCKLKTVRPPAVTERKVRPWTASQVTAAREALPLRYRAIADAAAGLGLRQGEVFALSPTDVNWLKGTVHVGCQVRIAGSKLCFAPPKRGRERDIPLPELTHDRLSAHLAEFPAVPVTLPWLKPGGRPVTRELMFTTTAGNALDRAYFHRLWREARKAAGVPNNRDNGLHALRHYYASVLLHGGVDIKALSQYLGHYDASLTLRIYCHLLPEAGERAAKAINAAFTDQDHGPDTVRAVQK